MRLSTLPSVPAALLALLESEFPGTPEDLGAAVRALSESYIEKNAPDAAALAPARYLAAYARYYLPVNYAKLVLPLEELALLGSEGPLAKERLQVLDVGCGPGTLSLALMGYLAGRAAGPPREVAIAVLDEDSNAVVAAERLCRAWWQACAPGVALEWAARTADLAAATAFEKGKDFDLIFVGNALAEAFLAHNEEAVALEKALLWAAALSERLAPKGALLILEPALRRTSRFLHALRDGLLARGLHLYAPCLHEKPCPALERERDWCHERLSWELPAELAALDRAAGLEKDALAFSYLVVRREPGSLKKAFSAPQEGVVGRVISEPLSEKGKRGCVACTQEGRQVYYEALQREPAGAAAALEELRRGDIASFPKGRPAGGRTRLGGDEPPRRLG